MKPNRLQLMTKDDIPFPEGGLIITQPSIKDIGYIGEENFYLLYKEGLIEITHDKEHYILKGK